MQNNMDGGRIERNAANPNDVQHIRAQDYYPQEVINRYAQSRPPLNPVEIERQRAMERNVQAAGNRSSIAIPPRGASRFHDESGRPLAAGNNAGRPEQRISTVEPNVMDNNANTDIYDSTQNYYRSGVINRFENAELPPTPNASESNSTGPADPPRVDSLNNNGAESGRPEQGTATVEPNVMDNNANTDIYDSTQNYYRSSVINRFESAELPPTPNASESNSTGPADPPRVDSLNYNGAESGRPIQADAAREQQRQEQGQGEAIRRIVNSSTGEEIRIPPRGASLNTRYNINTGLNVVSSANGYRNAEHTPTPNASESNSTGPADPPRLSSLTIGGGDIPIGDRAAAGNKLLEHESGLEVRRLDRVVTVSNGTNVDTESIDVEVGYETTEGSEIGEAENNNAAASVHESESNSAAQEEADVNELVSSYEDLEEADVNELVSSYEDREEADVDELVSLYEDREEANVNDSVSSYPEQENVRDVTSENYSDRRVSSSFDSSIVSYDASNSLDTSTTSYDTRSSLGTSTTSYDTSSSLNSSYISYDRSSNLDSSYRSSDISHNSESNTGTYDRISSDSNSDRRDSRQLVKNDSYQQTNNPNNQRRNSQSF